MRKKEKNRKWLLAGLAPIIAGAAVWMKKKAGNKKKADERTRHEAALEYRMNQPGMQAAQPRAQVPVTAPRKGGQKRGKAMLYDARPAAGGSAPPPEKTEKKPFPLFWILPILVLGVILGMSLLDRRPARAQVAEVPGGNAENGRRLIQAWGCGSCHTVPGVPGAYGKVGPSLDQMAEQTYIAGMLNNNPDNLIRWIVDPQGVQPGNAMPNTGVSEALARDMAAYLYSLRSEIR